MLSHCSIKGKKHLRLRARHRYILEKVNFNLTAKILNFSEELKIFAELLLDRAGNYYLK